MALDTSYGENGLGYNREPGYPTTVRELVGRGTLAQIKTTHKDRFIVMVTSDDDIADIILGYLPFKVGQSFLNPNGNTDAPTLLTRMQLNRDRQARRKWYLDMDFEEGVQDETPSSGNGSITPPDLLVPEVSWSSETVTKACLYDVNGDFLGSSAGEPYGIELPFAMPILTIDRYESWFDPSVIVDYVNHVNSTPFFGAGLREALCVSIEDRKDTHVVFGGQYYRKVKYVFKFAVPAIPEVIQGHDLILVDRGTYFYDSSGNAVHFKAGGSDTTGNLDGSGGAFGTNVWLFARQMYPLANFNALGFWL